MESSLLLEMFPTTDSSVILSALRDSGGSIDRTVEKLLPTQSESGYHRAECLGESSGLGSAALGETSSSGLGSAALGETSPSGLGSAALGETSPPGLSSAALGETSSSELGSAALGETSPSGLGSAALGETSSSELGSLLVGLQKKEIDFSRSFDLEVNRSPLWCHFYKNSYHSPQHLRVPLRIEFSGEDGIVAGALRSDFFDSLLHEVNDRLFEDQYHRVLKKDWDLDQTFHTAGLIIAHSILQGGPAFPCLCPAVFSFILFDDKERALSEFQCTTI